MRASGYQEGLESKFMKIRRHKYMRHFTNRPPPCRLHTAIANRHYCSTLVPLSATRVWFVAKLCNGRTESCIDEMMRVFLVSILPQKSMLLHKHTEDF